MENNHSEHLPNTTILLTIIMWKIMLFLITNPYGQLLTATSAQILFITALITQTLSTTPEIITGSIVILMSLFITIRNPKLIKRNNKKQEQHQHTIDIQHQVELLHRTANYHHNKKFYNTTKKKTYTTTY